MPVVSADVMPITNLGLERLAAVNVRLESLLASLSGDPEHSIRAVTRHLTWLSQILRQAGDKPAPTEAPDQLAADVFQARKCGHKTVTLGLDPPK